MVEYGINLVEFRWATVIHKHKVIKYKVIPKNTLMIIRDDPTSHGHSIALIKGEEFHFYRNSFISKIMIIDEISEIEKIIYNIKEKV